MQTKNLLINSEWEDGAGAFDVVAPFSGEIVGKAAKATPAQFQSAIKAAAEAAEMMRIVPKYELRSSLKKISDLIGERRVEFANMIALESAKPLRHATVEVERAIETFRLAAVEAERFCGDVVPVEMNANSVGRRAFTSYRPRGVIFGITPFNYPLNLVAHKVAPALASGNAIIVKPSDKTPLTTVMLGEVFLKSGMPKSALQILHMDLDVLTEGLGDERIAMISFTGSDTVGWKLKAEYPRKQIALELGGNAPVIVDDTCGLDDAARRIAGGAFAYSGQVCISVQRILADRKIADVLTGKIEKYAKSLEYGDPLSDSTEISVMINKQAAEKTIERLNQAVEAGAKILFGGGTNGSYVEPTLVSNVKPEMSVVKDEIFGPVATLEIFDDIAGAVELANSSRFGLQAGVFSNSLRNVEYALAHLEYGGILINDVPAFRVDNMPYGGIKESGYGREGVRYAMEEMCEQTLAVIRSGSPDK